MEQKERPILFSAPMVKAILEGRKTQTRRVIKLRKGDTIGRIYDSQSTEYIICGKDGDEVPMEFACPYGSVGDRLWVRESFAASYEGKTCQFKADGKDIMPPREKWRPSIFMPRWASRITLEITDVRVQRVQEISLEDADAEGVSVYDSTGEYGDVLDYRTLWNKINGKIRNRQFTLDDKSNKHYIKGQIGEYSWEANPWVWAITFWRI